MSDNQVIAVYHSITQRRSLKPKKDKPTGIIGEQLSFNDFGIRV